MVSWNVTSRCHLRCPHCYIAARSDWPSDELSGIEGRNLLYELAGAGTSVVILSGGEPLLRKDIYSLIGWGTELGLHMAMGTSGTLITQDVAGQLKDAGIVRIAVSLDSHEPKAHDRFRGRPGAWKQAVQGITAARKAGIPVQLNISVTRENYTHIDDLISFGESLGIEDFQVFFVVPVGRGKMVKDVSPHQYEHLIREILERVAVSDLRIRPTCAPQFMRIARQMGIRDRGWVRGCIAGISYCRVGPDGEVTPCPYLPVSAGNVRKNTFKEIWYHSPLLNDLRDPSLIEGKCGICEYLAICGGCRARAYGISAPTADHCGSRAVAGGMDIANVFGEDPWCPYEPEGEIGT